MRSPCGDFQDNPMKELAEIIIEDDVIDKMKACDDNSILVSLSIKKLVLGLLLAALGLLTMVSPVFHWRVDSKLTDC